MQPDSSVQNLFPYGAATQAEVMNLIRMNGNEADIQNLSQTLSNWRVASNHFIQISNQEQGIAETAKIKDINEKYKSKITTISSDYLFQQAFSFLPFEFKLIEIEKVVAAQRLVDLSKVASLKGSLPNNPTEEDLIDFCIAPKHLPPHPKVLQLQPNSYAFSSPNVDFRFLGGYPKPLGEDDVKACLGGGLPVAAIVLLFGYGSSTCNVFSVGNRLVLNNGFHRLYALLDMGIKYAPVVVQKISNPNLEFPEQVAGLPKGYLIGDPRPVLMKDFVDKQLITIIHRKPMIRNVQIVWQDQPANVPV